MLLYVRHGSVTNPREPERLRHKTDRLTPAGRRQAHQVGQYLKGLQPTTFTTSPLPRAEEFARIIGDHLGVHPTIDPALETWDTGDLSGRKLADVRQVLMDHIDNPHRPVQGGEPLDAAMRRIVPALQHRVNTPGVHLVVGHGRGVTLLDGLASPVGGVGQGVDPVHLNRKPSIDNGGIIAVSPSWERKRYHDHLKG
jgi:glucosyl-3-phosphoglycerate phosphatase